MTMLAPPPSTTTVQAGIPREVTIVYTLGYDTNSGLQAIKDETTPATNTINNSNNTTKNSTIHT